MTTQARELAGIISNAGDLSFIDDVTLKSDSAVLNFGADSDTTLTHVADTGLLVNSTRQLQFGDSGTYINQSSDGVLNLTSDTEVEINATTVDINANVDISGNLVLGGNITIGDADSDSLTLNADLTSHLIPNATNTYDLGTASKEWRNAYFDGTVTSDAFAGPLTGAVTGNADTATEATNVTASANNSTDETVYPTFVDGATGTQGIETDTGLTYNPSSGLLTTTLLAGTLNTAAQTNITSLGTLTTLTVDDMTLNGSTISDASDLTLDLGGDLIIDVDGDNVWFDAAGTRFLSLSQVSSDVYIGSEVQDKDIIFRGNDGGSTITALTLDMSDAGTATFNHDIKLNDNGEIRLGTGADLLLWHDSNNSHIGNYYGVLYIDQNTNDGNLILRCDDGSGGLAEYIALDGGSEIIVSKKSHKIEENAYIGQQALTSSSSAVAWNAKTQANAYHVTTENTTFSAPSNAVEGAIISVEIAQGGTARTIAWNTVFEFAASTAPTMTATANKTDIYSFRYNGSVWQEIGRVQNMAQT